MEQQSKKKQGFGAMDPVKARAIQRLGGRAAHRLGLAHEFTPAEARAAGKRGGRGIRKADRPHLVSHAPV